MIEWQIDGLNTIEVFMSLGKGSLILITHFKFTNVFASGRMAVILYAICRSVHFDL